MPAPFIREKHWLSAYELARSSRIMQFSKSGVRICKQSIVDNIPITVIVLVDSCGKNLDTLASLANLQYTQHEVIFVYFDPKRYDREAGHFDAYKHLIPIKGVFKPENKLTLWNAANAGLQNLQTSYFVVLQSGDMLHSQALGRMAYLLQQGTDAGVECLGFRCNQWMWATPAVDRCTVQLLKSDRVKALGGFPPKANASFEQKLALPYYSELLYFHPMLDRELEATDS